MVGASAPLILLEDEMKYFLAIFILIIITAPYFVNSDVTVGSMAKRVVAATETVVEGAKDMADSTADVVSKVQE